MAKRIKIRVFNTLESNNLMVSGWYSCKNNNSKRYGLFTGTTEGLDNERQVYCKEFMKPNVKIVSTDLWQICIKIRHCDRNLVYEHEYRDWNDDICIGWLRPGNLGDDTVNWFFNGKKDCWYNGGEKGDSLVVSHRVICGNIPPSVGLGNPSSETSTGSEGNGSASGGHYVRPGSEENSSASGGHYVRPGSEGNTSASGGQYVRPGSEGNGSASGGQYVRPGSEGNSSASGGHYVRPGSEEKASTPGRLYPTGKGSVLQNYMNADGSPKEPDRAYPAHLGMGDKEDTSTPGRLYPTGKGSVLQNYMNADGSPKEPDRAYPKPLGMGDKEDTSTPGRLYPTGKGSVLQNYMNADGSPKEPDRAYPAPLGMRNTENDKSEEDTEEKDGPRYVRPNSKG